LGIAYIDGDANAGPDFDACGRCALNGEGFPKTCQFDSVVYPLCDARRIAWFERTRALADVCADHGLIRLGVSAACAPRLRD
jgi:hypothetical protein